MKDFFGSDIKLTKNDRQLAVVLVIALLIMVVAILFLSSGSSSTSQSGPSSVSQCSSGSTQQQISCLTQLAASTNNATICSSLPSYQKDTCLYQVASDEKNITICSGIDRNDSQYSQCVETLAQNSTNPGACDYLPAVSATACIYSSLSASNFDNINVCSALNNASNSESCRTIYYYQNALKTNNAADCAYLQSSANFSSMYAIINNYSAIGTQGELGLVSLNISPRDYCYAKLAQALNNASLCGLTTTTYGNYLCTYSLAQTSNTLTFSVDFNATNVSVACGGAPNSYYKNFCSYSYITNKAVVSKNPSTCLQLNLSNGQFSCITQSALLSDNAAACDLISNDTNAGLCYNQTIIYNSNYNATQ